MVNKSGGVEIFNPTLAGGFNPFEKILVRMGIFPK